MVMDGCLSCLVVPNKVLTSVTLMSFSPLPFLPSKQEPGHSRVRFGPSPRPAGRAITDAGVVWVLYGCVIW